MKVHRVKRGVIELSINMMIYIILGITFLIVFIQFFRTSFGEGTSALLGF